MSYSPGSEAAVLVGDYVGVESCIDLRNAEEFEAYERDRERSHERRRRRRGRKEEAEEGDRRWRSEGRERKEFPPPISCLARTENQPSHMPWVMKRYHTADGRLVIREEKVRHHEYFRAHRFDGRLTLQLVPLDDIVVEDCCGGVHYGGVDVESCDDSCIDVGVGDGSGSGAELKTEVADEAGDEEEEVVDDDGNIAKVGVGDEAMMSGSAIVSSVSMSAFCVNEGVNGGGFIGGGSSGLTSASTASGGGGGKKYCYGVNSLRSSSGSSLFDLQIPAIRSLIS